MPQSQPQQNRRQNSRRNAEDHQGRRLIVNAEVDRVKKDVIALFMTPSVSSVSIDFQRM